MTDHDGAPLPPPEDGQGVPAPAPADTPPKWWNRKLSILPVWAWGAIAVVGLIGSAPVLLSGGGDDDVADPTVPPESVADEPFRVELPTTTVAGGSAGTDDTDDAASTTDEVAATDPSTTEAATATTVADAGSGDATTTIAPTTTVAEAATTTIAPTTTIEAATTTIAPTTTVDEATTTTTTVEATTTTVAEPTATTTTTVLSVLEAMTVTSPDGESITVTPRRTPCRYGPECVTVAFTIDGFSPHPETFTCEFSSGARYVFKFGRDEVDPACTTADQPDEITVVIGGVRSATINIGALAATT
ncbi:MAG: hypothetical protein QNJ12_03970 [Ilumatobacter sp.]|uniref:hypothetical protein n=1 Tax=Ilumatobacter sp. TaxID=1967498 RepID=UPI0026030E32|nr:hypothetical protein [Ilumatobacter sp.]MDJ0767920.1 hypothetical protein [Ilumatobacter sp.]